MVARVTPKGGVKVETPFTPAEKQARKEKRALKKRLTIIERDVRTLYLVAMAAFVLAAIALPTPKPKS